MYPQITNIDIYKKPASMNEVWVFHGSGAHFASGVFSSRENGENWIFHHKLSGMLTCYPLDKGAYDWAILNETFDVKNQTQTQPEFIQKFTSASQPHFHYENGELD